MLLAGVEHIADPDTDPDPDPDTAHENVAAQDLFTVC